MHFGGIINLMACLLLPRCICHFPILMDMVIHGLDETTAANLDQVHGKWIGITADDKVGGRLFFPNILDQKKKFFFFFLLTG